MGMMKRCGQTLEAWLGAIRCPVAGWGVTLEPQGGERVKFCPRYLFSPHIVPIDLRTKYQTHKESKGDCLIGVLVKGQRAHVSVLG